MRTFFIIAVLALAAATSDAVRIDIDCSRAQDLCPFGNNVKTMLEAWYPYFAEVLHSPGFVDIASISIYFDPDYDGVAYAAGGRIVGAVNYYRTHQDDIGSMIHEMVHVIQKYPQGCPGWFTEGCADYWRYYHFEPNRKPGKPGSGNSYKDGYGVSAYFLDFIQRFYGDMLYWVNKDCREGTYNDNMWPRLLGKNLDQLWADMLARG